MRTAIISDIHANPLALRHAVDDALAHGVGEFISLGDFVGYGPDPDGAIELSRRIFRMSVLGNHDEALLRPTGIGDSKLTLQGAECQREAYLKTDNMDFVRSLPMSIRYADAIMFHGDAFVDEGSVQYGFGYICDTASAQRCFYAMKAEDVRLAFVGHTHEPAVWSTVDGSQVCERPGDSFIAETGTYNIVNVGSIGCPRSVNYSSYVIIEPCETGTLIEFRQLEFDYIGYQKALIDSHVEVPNWVKSRVKMTGNDR